MSGEVKKQKSGSVPALVTLAALGVCLLMWSKSGQGAELPTSALWSRARLMLPGIFLFTGLDLLPSQTELALPELADPYVTLLRNSAIISGTAQYHLKFRSLRAIARGGPYQLVWNEFYDADGTTPLGESRNHAHSWDMKPVLWKAGRQGKPRLWDRTRDPEAPLMVWYGGHMRPKTGERLSHWPQDNFSRDVFAFTQRSPGKWVSEADSIFKARGDWPRVPGSFLGHRYGHQIVETADQAASVFFEEVTEVFSNGGPKITRIFVDQMISPLLARGQPKELISPTDSLTGRPYPSTLREDGAALVEGPLYFRFTFEGEHWEAIGFSAGSFYGKYPSCFASRRVEEGKRGEPYRPDLNDEGSDLQDAGSELGASLNLMGGPGRPSVIVGRSGRAIRDVRGNLQVLFHAYLGAPGRVELGQMFRGLFHASLSVVKGARPGSGLRFKIVPSVQSLRANSRSRIHAANGSNIAGALSPDPRPAL